MRIRILAGIALFLLAATAVYSYTSHPGVPPCVPKPYPVTVDLSKFPPELHEGLLKFVDDMNYRIIDEIYLRFCNYIADDIFLGCSIPMDTIFACKRDTLYAIFKALAIRDTSVNQEGAAIILYEDSSDGAQYAGFRVARNGDTLSLDSSYVLVMPKDNGGVSEEVGPRGINLAAGPSFANQELLSDGGGNLYWIDRDWFRRIMIDTVVAETSHTPFGRMTFEAELIEFKTDTNRRIVGKWGGGRPAVMRFYEGIDAIFGGTGTQSFGLSVEQEMYSDVSFFYPDTVQPYDAIMTYTGDGAGDCNGDWQQYDYAYTQEGLWCVRDYDSLSTTITINFAGAPESFDVPNLESRVAKYYDYKSYRAFVSWGPYAPTLGSAEWDSLRAVSTIYDATTNSNVGIERYLSDSSFQVIVPTGDFYNGGDGPQDSLISKTIRWLTVGFPKRYDGVNRPG